MSALLDGCYSPIARQERLEHLLILDAPEEQVPAQVWNTLHAEVQRVLGDLDDEVQRRVPETAVVGGRTSGKAFLLFSYRTYRMPDSRALDAVVAGITFSRKNGEIIVQGDVSGEQRGDSIATVPEQACETSREQLMETARKVANRLRGEGSKIADALLDASRKVE